ncbi:MULTISPECIES: fumarylacetoacetate hydrolase family protein [Pseudomonas]|uniref:fumarylacetoacetate hydrolase family protein n=1 Tax=Pseudomonas TaxID=286 RepID=UPI0039900D57
MKLLSFRVNGEATFGAMVGDRVVDLKPRLLGKYADLRSLLEAGALSEAEEVLKGAEGDYRTDEISYLPVIPNPPKIICIGLNYQTHVDETSRERPPRPMLFARFTNSLIEHEGELPAPPESPQLDYEAEIAVIIGKRGRRISQQDAYDYVAGYAPFNDGSIRDWMWHSTQWTPGKNFYRTGGLGPCMTTRGEIADGQPIRLIARLNGAEMQNATSDEMLFTIPELIEYISEWTELEPGDIIATGTPGGIGLKRDPQIFMKDGDVVEIEIPEVGVLRNYVRKENV